MCAALFAPCSLAPPPANRASSTTTTSSIHSTSPPQLRPPSLQHPSPHRPQVVSQDVRARRSPSVDQVPRGQPRPSVHPGRLRVAQRHARMMPVKRVQENMEDEYTPQNLARLQVILQELGFFDRAGGKTPA
ncbi:unnamed protein product [Lampetra fluviatilis]